ncbi:MAG: hypothetical protein ACRDHN_07740, partial [Thermomicrobiales bacterium]
MIRRRARIAARAHPRMDLAMPASDWIIRPYRGPADLRAMQAIVSAAFAHTDMHIGDVAWNIRASTHRQLGLDIHLWEAGDRLLAWSYFHWTGNLMLFADPDFVTDLLIDDMLATVEGLARDMLAAGDPLSALSTYGLLPGRSALDQALIAGLERHGYT